MRAMIRAAIKEPLVHFLLAGLALFLFFAWRGEPVDPESRTIVISEDQVERLALRWVQTWRRPPTETEIDGMIRHYVKEEVYYREGLRLGLDQDDPIIRRRIRSKMEYLANAELENAVPDDAVLQAVLDRNPAAYAAETRVSFDQVYLAAQDEAAARTRAQQLLQTLKAGADPQPLGDAISLPRRVEAADRGRVSADFGEAFAAALGTLRPGQWEGPISSGFGIHLVRVRSVQTSGKPKLADVRQAVENDWRTQTMRERETKAYQTLLDGYTIRIARP